MVTCPVVPEDQVSGTSALFSNGAGSSSTTSSVNG